MEERRTLHPLTTWSISSSTVHVRSSMPLPGVSRISGLAARALRGAARGGPATQGCSRQPGQACLATRSSTASTCGRQSVFSAPALLPERLAGRVAGRDGARLRDWEGGSRRGRRAVEGSGALVSAALCLLREPPSRASTAPCAARPRTRLLHPLLPRLLQLVLARVRQLRHLRVCVLQRGFS